MSTFNPYAQQGWNSQHSMPSGSRPSMYGALPFSPPVTLPTLFAFRFTSFAPTILNCTVIGPQSRPYFRVLTDAPVQGVTGFQNAAGTNIALVQWHRHPEVEVQGAVSRQRSSQMLALTPDQSARAMTLNNGSSMTFTPRENFIWIYSNTSDPELLGRISRGQTSVTLELTGEAIHRGLLESAVVATFLLQCGRNID
ncbi:hypothetical protein MIND_01360800 [Mycena indigotica]|uniref:Uncharacterized protein n=1 Tax=Mycena indigotica TaxID=2126181 RepID=A0A8H6RYW2_9AGAR|nr:uncharacterized protein MIND_01360800 [Mycena indigotica]KAF7289864.1 hypothetical protein MIND_01360800 [Mycena indigotica]